MAFNRIMFVCTGNICRSPMAEYLLKNHAGLAQEKYAVSSSGLGALVGHPADPAVRALLEKDGISCSEHIARQINQQMVDDADIILVMENHHRQGLIKKFPQARSKVFLLLHHEQAGIVDPYTKDLSVFEQVKYDIQRGLDQWVDTLRSV